MISARGERTGGVVVSGGGSVAEDEKCGDRREQRQQEKACRGRDKSAVCIEGMMAGGVVVSGDCSGSGSSWRGE